MGLLQRLGIKRQTSPDKVTGSMVRTSETRRSGRWAHADLDIRKRMEMATGYVGIACKINADALAGCQLKLYRKASSGEGRGRKLTKVERKRLTNPGVVGQKAALYGHSDNVEEVTDHPALDVFRDPTPFGQAFGLFQLMFYQAELCGNAFLHVYWENGRPWFVNLFPQFVEVVPNEDASLRYFFGRESTHVQEFPADEIMHYKLMESTYKPWIGDTWVSSIIGEHEMYLASVEHEVSRWHNEARPDLVIGMPDGTTTEQLEEAKANWEADHRGSRNSGRVVFARASEIVYDNTKPREMDYGEGRQWIKTVVANASGIPASMLDMTDASLGSAIAGDTQYGRQTLQPRLTRWAEFWTERLLAEGYGIAPGDMWFAPDMVVKEDEQAQASIHSTYVGAGIMTIDEAREELGLPSVEGGDVPRINGQTFENIEAMATAGGGAFGGFGDADPFALPAGDQQQPALPSGSDNEEPVGEEQELKVSESAVLNGAQIQAAKDIVLSVSAGELPRDSGLGQLETLFNLTPEQARAIMGSAGTSEPTTPNPRPEEGDDAEVVSDQRDGVSGQVTDGDADAARSGDDDAGVDGGSGGRGLPSGANGSDPDGPQADSKELATVVDQKAWWLEGVGA